MASGINNTFRQVGIATGIAALGAIFQHEITHKVSSALGSSGHGGEIAAAAHGRLNSALVSGEVAPLIHSLPPLARGVLGHAYRTGFTEALTTILLVAAAVALLGAVFAFALVRGRDFVTAQTPADAPQAEPVGAVAG
jgi:hypothetical protein